MASSSSGHSPGEEVGLVGQEVGLVGQEVGLVGQQDVGQHVGLAVFMVGHTGLMVVVAQACLLALCFAAAAMLVLCNIVGFAIGDWYAHNSPGSQAEATGVEWELRRWATQLACCFLCS